MMIADSHLKRLAEPELRGTVITVAASLAVLFVVQLNSGLLVAAGVPILCGIAGLLLRWTAMPYALVITLGYFLFFPLGVPIGMPAGGRLRQSYLRFDDLLLGASLFTYLVAQFRLFDLTAPTLARPTATLGQGEALRAGLGMIGFVIAGQTLWWLVTNLEPNFESQAPLRWKPRNSGPFRQPSTQTDELSRMLMLVTLVAGVAGLARFAVWYLRLLSLTRAEARLILLDTQWQENRRELARQATWHARSRHSQNSPRSGPIFRWIVRGIVLAIFVGFLAFILTVYFQNEAALP